MDKIILRKMKFFGYHGVFPEENKLGQRFYVDATLFFDIGPAGSNDDLEKTVNYAEAYYTIKKIVEQKQFKLIEALAEHIATSLLDTYTIINEIEIRVTKPHPPFDIHFEGVTVEIHRKRVQA
ncbi:dihydroneopterin aldolase [Paenibacillus gansuensis]|uniref:7,8-dihydroneopterin aldolase n=1 Tax=Paenibacillus gansuensis TaxID=306542 RepID=A0ABW5PBI7_9BACL